MSKNSRKNHKYNRAKVKQRAHEEISPTAEEIDYDYDRYDGDCHCDQCCGPSLYDIMIGKFVTTLQKLRIRAAKLFLEDWYW